MKPTDGEDISGAFPKAARKHKVTVNREEFVMVTRPDARVAIAPSRGSTPSPAAEMGDGADAALAYIDLPGARIKPGHYKVRVSADATRTGAALRAHRREHREPDWRWGSAGADQRR